MKSGGKLSAPTTVFRGASSGNQLEEVTRLIRLRAQTGEGASRQVTVFTQPDSAAQWRRKRPCLGQPPLGAGRLRAGGVYGEKCPPPPWPVRTTRTTAGLDSEESHLAVRSGQGRRFGASDAQSVAVFPNPVWFPVADIGFMASCRPSPASSADSG
ncbi:protein of unknown function [Methylococcus capsulatus]|uniref:Uncharacterized protein n=1 Tax=Methylococcus capsulatus TaxID=414 RepID=A0AA35UD87_METCP|nr:protein of unknown function [Methylococcus capsulatus]